MKCLAEGVVAPRNEGEAAAAAGAPLASPIQEYINELHERYAASREGEVADYIPELAKADPEWFGISVATTDGHLYEAGDTRQPFTIQSISKPFVYGLALEDQGREAVLAKIGVEPTGDVFNSISLAPGSGRPLNPMINAGAIAATSLIAGRSYDDRLERLIAVISSYAGRPLSVDRPVYESERETGHRNRAIAFMLRNFDIITKDPQLPLDLYFQQCSIAVDCRDLSLMAATLANGGLNPLTGERAVRQEFVDSILSVMTTCGMYDYAGEWVYWVGVPAKSGVSGGVLAVLPGQLGIGVFSPRLDARGNSVRGVAVCKDLSREFNLHFLRAPRSAKSVIRSQHSIADVSSKRLRSQRERQVLDAFGDRARVYELQGDLVFSALEIVVRTLAEAGPHIDFAIVDLKRVTMVDACAAKLFLRLVVEYGGRQRRIVLVNTEGHHKFLRSLEEGLAATDQWGRLATFPDLDSALDWCENHLISEHEPSLLQDRPVALAEHETCSGLRPEDLARLERVLQPRSFDQGELIIRKGDPADGVYLLTDGEASATLVLPNGRIKRLSTFNPGMAFGELALIDRSERTANVRADTPVRCYLLSAAALDRLGDAHPGIKMRVLENLLRHVSRTVSRLNQEVWALSS